MPPATLPDCPDNENTPFVYVHDVFELYCETRKAFSDRTIAVANDINLDAWDRNTEHTLRGLTLAKNVTLRGWRGGLDEGPVISTSNWNVSGPLFDLRSEQSRITGIRFGCGSSAAGECTLGSIT